jgi:hypothetical protein
MPNLTPEKEAAILAALKTKIESVAGVSNVLVENPLVSSKHDEIDLLTVENVDGEAEIKYCYVSFLGFTDSETDGCDDMPVVFLDYNLHFFWEFKEKRSDNSSSETDFKTLFLNIRNKFREPARNLAASSEHQPLRQSQFIILSADPLTGAYGWIADFTCKVEIL